MSITAPNLLHHTAPVTTQEIPLHIHVFLSLPNIFSCTRDDQL